MSGLIEHLERLNATNTKVRAVLRRSLSFEPGTFIQAFPYIEPFLKDSPAPWRRAVFYLVAALWASQGRAGMNGAQPIAAACAAYQRSNGSTSVERRFIALLDADEDQLPHRLRKMISLLKDHPIDFEMLLRDLLFWQDDRKRTQNVWARQFYRALDSDSNEELEQEAIG